MFTNMQRHMLRHIVAYFYAIGCRIVNWVTADGCVVRSHRRIRQQSSRIHVHTADADATRLDSFVSSESAVCIGLKYAAEKSHMSLKHHPYCQVQRRTDVEAERPARTALQ